MVEGMNCFSCGETETVNCATDYRHGVPYASHVECSNCGAQLKRHKRESDAVDEWKAILEFVEENSWLGGN